LKKWLAPIALLLALLWFFFWIFNSPLVERSSPITESERRTNSSIKFDSHQAPDKIRNAKGVDSVTPTHIHPVANCQTLENDVPDFNDAFIDEYLRQFPNSRLLIEDLKLLKEMSSELSRLAALQLTEVDTETNTITGESGFKGQSYAVVEAAANNGNPQAQQIVGAHEMYMSFTQTDTIQIDRYKNGSKLLLNAARNGQQDALELLRILSLFSHRVGWRKSNSIETATYDSIKADHIAYDELARKYGGPASFFLLQAEEIPPVKSTLGLTEPPINSNTLKLAEERKQAYEKELGLPEPSNELKQKKERIAWLRQNVDIFQIIYDLNKFCGQFKQLTPSQ